MTDIQAAMGLIELERYEENLARRKAIFKLYDEAFSSEEWALTPRSIDEEKESSYHLYLLRINGITEAQRDSIIQKIVEKEVSVNVHFQPLPLLTAYKNLGYSIENYPEAFNKYKVEISLPVYFNLSDANVKQVIDAVISSVHSILKP